MDRRTFCLGLTAGAATNGTPLFGSSHLTNSTIANFGIVDVHTHIFNGTDVPAIGFVLNAVLRDQHEPIIGEGLKNSLLKLVYWIFFRNSLSASEELDLVQNREAPADWKTMAEQDRQKVEAKLRVFIEGEATELESYSTTREQDLALVFQIATEVEYGDQFQRDGGNAARDAFEIVDRIYAPGPFEGFVRTFLFPGKIIEHIRWAGIKTRPRFDILGELVRLYGGEGRVQIFTPSIVDLDMWFKTGEQSSDVLAQIKLYHTMAQKVDEALILPFAPFCPLRAALEREVGVSTSFDNLNTAIKEYGFFGVKLYPTMGFRPMNNEDNFDHTARVPQGLGGALDHELTLLYEWCLKNDAPIKAHANNSMAAGHNTGPYAHPSNWAALLSKNKYRNLRVNLAHFGGFEESEDLWTDQNICDFTNRDWDETIAREINSSSGLYFDLGYWMELADSTDPYHRCAKAKAQALFNAVPQMYDRALYGSDWSMIGKELAHRSYLENIGHELAQPGFERSRWNNIMGLNALKYLGLDRPGKQFDRLMQFHANHPVVQEMFT